MVGRRFSLMLHDSPREELHFIFNLRHITSPIQARFGCSRARAPYHSYYVPLCSSQSVLAELRPGANHTPKTFTYLHISLRLFQSATVMYGLKLVLFHSAVKPPDDLTYSGKIPLMVFYRHIKITAASVW